MFNKVTFKRGDKNIQMLTFERFERHFGYILH